MICPQCQRNNLEGAQRCFQCGLALASSDDATLAGGDASAAAKPVSHRSPFAIDDQTPGGFGPLAPVSSRPSQSNLNMSAGPGLGSDFGPRYKIESILGQGGMGCVYRAYDKELDRTVAIKVLRSDVTIDASALQRFKQELLLAREISHKNVLRIHDLGDVGGVKFISMAYVEGEDLHQVLEKHGRLPVDRALHITSQLCEALAAAHAAGVVHRDFKPQNVLLDRADNVYVSDFGLAKSLGAIDAGLTRSGALMGTPLYMSPEQVEAKPVDHRTDLYALGLILYEMVTGAKPFSGNSVTEILIGRIREKPKNPKVVNPALPDYLARVIMRCLEKNPEQRYQSAREILQDLSSERAPTVSRSLQINLTMPGRRGWLIAGAAALLVALAMAAIPVRNLIHRRSRANSTAAGVTTVHDKYLAILPFHVLGEQASLGYRANGLVEALAARLFQLRNVHVASASAVERASSKGSLAQIAPALGVNLIVQGTVEGVGDRIRIVMNLEDVAAGRRLWTQEFTGVSNDLLTLEDQIYNKLVDALELNPGTEERARVAMHPTENIEAYDLYLRGRNAMHGGKEVKDVATAIDFYNQALQKDTGFAVAYAGLADANLLMYRKSKESSWSEKALAAAQQARRLNENLPEAHFALGSVYNETGKTAEAAAELKHALELAPNSDEGYRRLAGAYRAAGRKDAALESYRKAIELNPYYWLNYYELGQADMHFGDYDKARTMFGRVTELDPENAPAHENIGNLYFLEGKFAESVPAYQKALQIQPRAGTYSNVGEAYFYLKRYGEAVKMLEKAVEMSPSAELYAGNLGDTYRWFGETEKAKATYAKAIDLALNDLRVNPRNSNTLGHLAQYYAKIGDSQQALQLIRRARSMDPNNVDLISTDAVVQTLAGRFKPALEALREALQKGYSTVAARSEPELEKLRAFPEYEKLMKEFSRK